MVDRIVTKDLRFYFHILLTVKLCQCVTLCGLYFKLQLNFNVFNRFRWQAERRRHRQVRAAPVCRRAVRPRKAQHVPQGKQLFGRPGSYSGKSMIFMPRLLSTVYFYKIRVEYHFSFSDNKEQSKQLICCAHTKPQMLIGYKASVSNLFKLKNKTCVFNLVRNVWF